MREPSLRPYRWPPRGAARLMPSSIASSAKILGDPSFQQSTSPQQGLLRRLDRRDASDRAVSSSAIRSVSVEQEALFDEQVDQGSGFFWVVSERRAMSRPGSSCPGLFRRARDASPRRRASLSRANLANVRTRFGAPERRARLQRRRRLATRRTLRNRRAGQRPIGVSGTLLERESELKAAPRRRRLFQDPRGAVL